MQLLFTAQEITDMLDKGSGDYLQISVDYIAIPFEDGRVFVAVAKATRGGGDMKPSTSGDGSIVYGCPNPPGCEDTLADPASKAALANIDGQSGMK
ncbi:MAG: hypothetical protein LH606_15800 [Cytophagaceae bacterium]|nr:hypothetical protein [Cytophagaceae bacterium]